MSAAVVMLPTYVKAVQAQMGDSIKLTTLLNDMSHTRSLTEIHRITLVFKHMYVVLVKANAVERKSAYQGAKSRKQMRDLARVLGRGSTMQIQ